MLSFKKSAAGMLSVLCGLFPLGLAPIAAAQTYTVTDLGVLPGGTLSQARAINNQGDVVGLSDIPGTTHAFLSHQGKLTDLGSLGGISDAWTIDDAGRITGVFYTAGGAVHDFAYADGVMTDLGPSGSSAGPTPPAGGSQVTHTRTNRSGVICGTYLNAQHHRRAFVTDKGVATDIGTLPGFSESRALAINAGGDVLCDASAVSEGKLDGSFLWRDGKTVPLPELPQRRSLDAYGLNDKGWIVGRFETSPSYEMHAFLFRDGRLIDLNSLLPAGSGWTLISAGGINDRGQIVGRGHHAGKARAFLLTPTADPSIK